ncbi:MAG TPA: type II secretion system protein [bacterium]|nr:type II secretion system protein [bacterium]
MKKKKGFTIVEILVATAILATSIIGTSAFFYLNRKNFFNADLKNQATWAAVERMEYLKGKQYSELEEDAEFLEEDPITLGENRTAERTSEISEVDEEGILYKKITVEVTWNDDKEKVSLVTYIAEN